MATTDHLQWNKPERVQLKPGMVVSYRSVSLWQKRGKILSVDGANIRVLWTDGVASDQIAYCLLVWTEQPTDPRDAFNG